MRGMISVVDRGGGHAQDQRSRSTTNWRARATGGSIRATLAEASARSRRAGESPALNRLRPCVARRRPRATMCSRTSSSATRRPSAVIDAKPCLNSSLCTPQRLRRLKTIAAAGGGRVSALDLIAESSISPLGLKALVNHGLGQDVTRHSESGCHQPAPAEGRLMASKPGVGSRRATAADSGCVRRRLDGDLSASGDLSAYAFKNKSV